MVRFVGNWEIKYTGEYSWIAFPGDAHKNQFGKQPEGLRRFRDHRWKALGEENSDLVGLFLFRQYFESYIE